MSRLSRIVATLALTFATTGCLDTTLDASYRTMSGAVADGAVVRGWIPPWVPNTAFDLREVHDLDSNESALSFGIVAGTKLTLPPQCLRVPASEILPQLFRRSWWPAEDELKESYTFYICHGEFVALHRSKLRVLHWRTNAR